MPQLAHKRTMFRNGFVIWLAFSGLMAPVLIGCGDEAATCVPGQSIACAGEGCQGHQICRDDGKAYDSCVCDGTPGQFPATGPNSGLIGAACEDKADCRLGLECIRSDSKLVGGEGPSAGMCLARCLPDHDFCQGLDALAKCVVLDDAGTPAEPLDDVAYCMPGCTLGAQAGELDKCRGRVDLVCTESLAGTKEGYCRPACRSDVDCGVRHCNLGTGLCRDATPTGAPIGSSCEPDAATSTCSGACLAVESGYAECSGVCSLGTPGCGQENTDTSLSYYCLHDSSAASGEGDLGYCAKLCDCDADCERDDAVCEPRSELPALSGRTGVCGSKLLPSGSSRKNKPCQ